MFTGASRRRRPAPHVRRSRERRARGPALSGRREVMERAWRQECCAGGCAFGETRGHETGAATGMSRGRVRFLPARHGRTKAAQTRHTGCGVVFIEGMPRGDAASISAYPVTAPGWTFSICRRTGHDGGFIGGLHRGLSRGLYRGLSRGLYRGFPEGLARGNATSIPNTARQQPDGRSPSVTAPGAARASLKGMPRGDAASISA